MFKWMDRVYVNARKKIFKNIDTGEILNLELQDDPDNISKESETPLTAHNLNQAQQELIDDLGKDYTGTNITAPTVAGWGRIKKLYGNTVEEGTGEKSPGNPYMLKCVGDDVNLFNKDGDITALSDKYGITLSNFINNAMLGKTVTLSINKKVSEIQFASSENTNVILRAYNSRSLTFEVTQEILDLAASRYLFMLNGSTWINLKTEQLKLGIKLQKGSVATPYSPYGYGTVENISTDGTNSSSNVAYVDKPLCSVEDVRDELDYTNKKITQRCGSLTINGSENWTAIDGLTNCLRVRINVSTLSAKDGGRQLSSHFKHDIGYSSDIEHFYIYGGYLYVYILKTTVDTVEEFKTWLSQHPVTVIYELATPITEDIDCSDKIVQYANNTNVYNRDGADIEVSLTNNDTISGLNEVDKVLEKKIEEVDEIIETRVQTKIGEYGLGGQCKSVWGDLNTACSYKTGFYMGHNLTNAPNGSTGWFYIIHLVHNNLYKHQIAISLGDTTIYNRKMENGVWSDWASR